MTREWRTKTFKSGNSVAVRFPKSVGFEEGEEVQIAAHPDGSFSLWRTNDSRRVFMSLYGSMSPGYMSEGRGDAEQGGRDWDAAPGQTRAA